MAERRARPVLAGVLIALVAVVVFPWQWVRSYRMAQRHSDEVPGAPVRVLAAIAVGVVLAGAGGLGLWLAQESFQSGAYDTLDEDLQAAVREQEYQDAVSTVAQRDFQIPIIQANLVNRSAEVDEALQGALATGDAGLLETVRGQWEEQQQLAQAVADADATGSVQGALDAYGEGDRMDALLSNWTTLIESAGAPEAQAQELEASMGSAVSLPSVLGQAFLERSEARARAQTLEAHHAFYLTIEDDIEAQDDEAVLAAIDSFAATQSGTESVDMEVVAMRFEHKSDVVDDMYLFFLYWPVFGWFSLIGLLFAPLVFVQGSILQRVYVPSDTVGFRPYPSVAMGWFLLLGAFNIPALLFSAWCMADIEQRSLEGQISL